MMPVRGVSESGDLVALSIRPEHIHITEGPGRIMMGTGTVLNSGFLGTHRQSSVQLEGTIFRVRLAQAQAVNDG